MAPRCHLLRKYCLPADDFQKNSAWVAGSYNSKETQRLARDGRVRERATCNRVDVS